MTRRRMRTRLLTAATTTSLLLALVPALAAAARPADGAPADAAVRKDPATGHARMVFRSGGYLTGTSAAPAGQIALDYVRAHREAFGLSAEQAGQLAVVSAYPTRHNGATQVTIGQVVDGMRVFGGGLTATVDRHGRLVLVGGSPATGTPSGGLELTDQDALHAAAEEQGAQPVRPLAAGGDHRKGKHRYPNVYARDLTEPHEVTAEAVWFPVDSGRTLRPAWVTDIESSGTSWYETVVDAEDGSVLSHESRYHEAGPQGTVFTAQHPDVPGAARAVTPLTGRDGSWVAARQTEGNNVNAYRDIDNDNAADPGRPQSPASGDPAYQHFDYAFGDTWRTNAAATRANADADVDAAVTQLFYYANVMHDYLYGLGFDEASGNFQTGNFGRGGTGGDAVLAEAQDGWENGCGTPANPVRCINNAFFGVPGNDGSKPRMQMYLWQPGYPYRDGDFDGDVIAHEYGHGLSSRLVGHGDLGGGPQNKALGEGWSDTVSFLKWGDAVIGEYVTGNATTGIRSVAYDNSTRKYGSFNGTGDEHDNGEIWASAMYDIRTAKGVAFTQQLVVDGMKNTLAKPSFLDARDGILAADMTNTGGANQCLLRRIFAARGMGTGATSSSDQKTVTADETVPAECLPTASAGGPYTTAEGTDVTLDASASVKGTAGSAGSLTSYAWDLDGDGDHDDATGVRPVFDTVGQDGVFPVGVQVTDSAGNTATAQTTVTVTNAAPAVALDPVGPAAENTPVTVTGRITDPGWLDGLTATVDWGDGAGPQPLEGTLENDRPDASLVFSVAHTYGDDGTFPVKVCGSDDDTSTCAGTDAKITNTSPTAVISPEGQTTYNGQKAYLAHAGVPVEVKASSADPGSDDLTLTWKWGDGSADSSFLSLVNPPATDPDPSPSVQPRAVSAARSHAYGQACVSTLTLTAQDDDGGSAADSAAVVTTGNAKQAHDQAWWMAEYSTWSPPFMRHFTAAQRTCLLGVASFMSSVYGPLTDAQAYAVLANGSPDARKVMSTQLLAAWLNFANGSYDLGTPVDTDGDSVRDTAFGTAVAAAEKVYLDPAATKLQLDRQTKILLAANVRDGG
ncbi:M36 family metallopeptidase [Streptomyces sp. NPDC089919]|uniref:M4 family metallopeptidase n=1 Tax=Streptomyces sp. NPDC089919 TaxID=3155188 RepID=UPI00342A55AC